MSLHLAVISTLTLLATATQCHAADLDFRTLEAAMPRNPPLWSADATWHAHATDSTDLAPAVEAVRQAIPPASPADFAYTVLKTAGARCIEGSDRIACTYQAIETRDEWMDMVDWTITVNLQDGRVAQVDLKREWSRR